MPRARRYLAIGTHLVGNGRGEWVLLPVTTADRVSCALRSAPGTTGRRGGRRAGRARFWPRSIRAAFVGSSPLCRAVSCRVAARRALVAPEGATPTVRPPGSRAARVAARAVDRRVAPRQIAGRERCAVAAAQRIHDPVYASVDALRTTTPPACQRHAAARLDLVQLKRLDDGGSATPCRAEQPPPRFSRCRGNSGRPLASSPQKLHHARSLARHFRLVLIKRAMNIATTAIQRTTIRLHVQRMPAYPVLVRDRAPLSRGPTRDNYPDSRPEIWIFRGSEIASRSLCR